MAIVWPWGWGIDIGVPDRWWERRHATEDVLGYRRWCPACQRMRTPRLHGFVGEATTADLLDPGPVGHRRPYYYQTCSGCAYGWPGPAITAAYGLGAGDTFQLRLSSFAWWVQDQVTLDELRHCPDIRSLADLMWERMERAGRFIEAEGAYR